MSLSDLEGGREGAHLPFFSKKTTVFGVKLNQTLNKIYYFEEKTNTQ